MFACVVPGRMVQQATQVPEAPERFVVSLEDAAALNHISVFMTGAAPFPEGYAATIHLDAPGKGWQLIGSLSNTKPSAIFRLRGTFIPSANASSFNTSSLSTSHASATLGILCEPIPSVEAQVAALSSSATAANPAQSTALVVAGANAPPDSVVLAQKVAKNLFNAVGSFAQGVQGPDGKMMYGIDLAVIEKWYTNFERKIKTGGVSFLLQQD
ncbi:hypothetical protein BCR35DRAFT_300654 [Leucosporidium creatinivorum]|uniref:Uncharacterized protein n=1 Tax=Leucosporidium creatinivorum TaxID=106004 RepID=A0A1Y2G0R3_9BASI|nr:hypothetical protein BCR35DRAFT_300654 [Leucosporidium creatinivorum]